MKLIGELIVVATQNQGKTSEFRHAFAKLGLSVHSMADYPALPEIIEDGTSFAENARIKAKVVGDALQIPVLADDSGLCVDALGGAPGVYSARYAGEGAADSDNNAKLLAELERLGSRLPEAELPGGITGLSTGRFVCALALYDPTSGQFVEAEGTMDGIIVSKPQGAGGFGYDPLLWVPEHQRTVAQLSKDEKQDIGHRGRALAKLLDKLS
ncbi:RdgB/HAM1 family non-canonical purine NTP pyrophosphatase [Paenibacillus sp. 1P07SE]|uniref:RdgB/HAM1 family non-canonical purine NTP pyrophosphatase n=1 Tax=Paenibacillus sp. 1P07SE TaxID=3132209 RepID=UPI0039A53B75